MPVDVYSFAMLVYELLTNEEPYSNKNQMEIIESIMNGVKPEFKKAIPECYKRLINKFWSQNPEDRPTFDEIVNELETNSDFITQEFKKYIQYCQNPDKVSYDPADRIQVERRQKSINGVIDSIDLDQFEKLNKIGSGSFGKVYKVKNKKTNKIYACKILLVFY